MVALPVPPQRLPVNLVRSGRKQPQREHRVPGCGWWGCLHLQAQFNRGLAVEKSLSSYRHLKLFLPVGKCSFALGLLLRGIL